LATPFTFGGIPNEMITLKKNQQEEDHLHDHPSDEKG